MTGAREQGAAGESVSEAGGEDAGPTRGGEVPKITISTSSGSTSASTSTSGTVAVPQRVHEALRLDFGPQFKKRLITKQPPGVGEAFPALVPQVDQDGNDPGGVRLPQPEVPLATYTG